jgi:hypothetical protein
MEVFVLTRVLEDTTYTTISGVFTTKDGAEASRGKLESLFPFDSFTITECNLHV